MLEVHAKICGSTLEFRTKMPLNSTYLDPSFEKQATPVGSVGHLLFILALLVVAVSAVQRATICKLDFDQSMIEHHNFGCNFYIIFR